MGQSAAKLEQECSWRFND